MHTDNHTVALDELVDLVGDKVASNKDWTLPYVGLEQMAEGSPDLLGTLPASVSVSVNGVFRTGDILFGKLRPNLRKSVLVRSGGYCSTDILVLRPKVGVVPEYAAKVFQSDAVFNAAVGTSEGTKMPRTSWDKLRKYRVRRFEPNQQRCIADILDAADEAIRQTEAVIAKLKLMKDGLLHDLLTRGLDAHGRLRDPVAHPEQFKDSVLGRIPKDWDLIPVERAGEVRLGRQRSPQHQTGRYPTRYLRVANVFDGFIDFTDVLEMDFTPAEKGLYSLQAGDILLNEGQSLELVGRSAIFDGRERDLCFQNTLVRFRASEDILPKYARGVFKYWLDTGRFMQIAKQTTSVAHLGADRFAKLSFPRPSVDEQRRIVTALDAIEDSVSAEQSNWAKLKLQKTGLMHDLLTGRVPVATAEVAKRG